MSIFKLDEGILLQVIQHLGLQDLQQLGNACTRFHSLVFNNPRVWHPEVLFPVKDARVTDAFIQQLVPRITRHYGIQTLRLIQLPLSWLGYLFIFDQFAHSVDSIQVETGRRVLQDLVHHLTVFAANLVVLQQDNHIPITFRQYCFDADSYAKVLADMRFLGQPSIAHISRLFARGLLRNRPRGAMLAIDDGITRLSTLDDPPFERLRQWQVVCTDDIDQNDQNDENGTGHARAPLEGDDADNPLLQLEALVCFLTGRIVLTHLSSPLSVSSPIPIARKRGHDHLSHALPHKQQKQHHHHQRYVSPSV
ncbi:hypothetical protein BC940DRAFT_291124 [Gongronella butleri]|nr:hypothetical protein BC940DRAFT_291124 [Gongronella butleri]